MKRVQMFVLALAAAVVVWGAEPDFAMPQTVDKNARTDLGAAVKKGDAQGALNALMRAYVSNSIIGEQGASQQSIELVQETALKFADSPLSPIFDALLAKMYYGEYSSRRWVYDERQMPMAPRPADITEWSGEQFKYVIDSLLDRSIATPSKLSALPIGDYPDIVIADQLTRTFYTTLYDFVCANGQSIWLGKKTDRFAKAGLAAARARGSVSAEALWQDRLIDCQPYGDRWQMSKDQYLALKGSEYACLPLSKYIGKYIGNSRLRSSEYIAEAAWAVGQIDSLLARWPSAPLADELKDRRQSLTQPRIDLSYDMACMPGQPLRVGISNYNTTDYVLNVYSHGPRASVKDLKRMRPVQSIKMRCDKAVPFISQDTVELTFDKAGYYTIVASSDGFDWTWSQPVQCVDFLPIPMLTSGESWLAIVNPQSGAPVVGANVDYKISNTKNPNIVTLAPTNEYGLTDVTKLTQNANGSHYYQSIKVACNGVTNDFEGINLCFSRYESEPEPQDCILTDRAIYHPGDSVHYLVVSSESGLLNQFAELTITLRNANYEQVEQVKAVTDEWGRACGAFAIPATGLTGHYSIVSDHGSKYFMVSDYRMPEFELVDVKVARDVPAKGEVTVTGRAVYYSGMPMVGATVNADLQECIWLWRRMPGDFVANKQATTSDNGEFSIVFTASELVDTRAYSVSLSATSPSGSTAMASSSVFSLGKQYVISLDVPNAVDGEKPFTPAVQLNSYSGESANFDVKWTIETLDSVVVLRGASLKDIDLAKIAPARYRLTVEPIDTMLADAASANFVLYNVSSGIVPDTKNIIWMPREAVSVPKGQQAEFLFGLTDSAYVYSGIVTETSSEISGKWYGKGYHTLKVGAAEGKLLLSTTKGFKTDSHIMPIGIEPEKPLQIVGETFRDKLVPGNVETWRLRVVDGDGKGVQAGMALDMYNHALDALTEHSFSINFYSPRPDICLYIRTYLSRNKTGNIFAKRLPVIDCESLLPPEFIMSQWWSHARRTLNSSIRIRGGRANSADAIMNEVVVVDEQVEYLKSAKLESAFASGAVATADYALDDVEEELAYDDAAPTGSDMQSDNIQFRDAEVPLAIWAPQLATDEQGRLCYSFAVPNANASWRLYASAWTQDTKTANLMRDFIANKPLMVQPNAPRFLRAGDKADVAIALLNNTDSVASAQAVVELFDPVTGAVFGTQTFACGIDSMAQSAIVARVEASSSRAAIGLRVKAWTSQFGDGEQLVIPVLPADASLIETTPFYLNPGDTTFTMTLPAQPDARISLTYCENPAWTIVSALPGLREDKGKYANSAAAAIFSAAIAQGIMRDNPEIASAIAAWQANPADSALVSMLEKNDDLKIAMLNATPWVQAAQSDSERMARLALLFDKKQTGKTIDDAIAVLQQLQLPDGGWAWSDWCKQSSTWVTGNVLAMMGSLKSSGYLPKDKRLDDMVNRALKYWDKEAQGPDITYAIVRKQFADAPISANGQKAIAKTVNDVLKHWKSYDNPAQKAMAAEALYLNGYPAKSRELMRSLSEFGVWSESQGLRFPSVNSLASYAIILKAYAMIEPGSRQVDGLRQQLIVRKQATDWGSSVVTSEVVASILASGTRWTVEAQGADITAGGERIAPAAPIETATGALRADLSSHAGQTLTVTAPGVGPSYGAVYSQFSQAMADVKASACDDLSIEKTLMVRRGAEWAYVDCPLQVGDRVKVQLTIHCRRNMQYVAIIDERPAAFEPVDQLPGWMWSQGAAFYRENRDAATDMHIVSLAPGTYQLTYEMNVNSAGAYSSGVATIQSQYAPELTAHSAGALITVLPN